MSEAMLQLAGVEKRYLARAGGQVAALRGIDLTLRRGDFLALHGPSGCGKTTLLLCAGALLRPDAGQVSIGGRDPYALSPAARAALRAAQVGFVFQDFHLVPYLSALDNVMLCALAGVPRDGLEARARRMLEKFGLAGRLGHRPAELSVGEQQRVALVRAVAGGASLLLADEPTGNLDPANGAVLLGYLREFAAGGGAVLMVTHDPAAGAHANRRRDMRDGRLSAEGSGEA